MIENEIESESIKNNNNKLIYFPNPQYFQVNNFYIINCFYVREF